MLTIEKTNICLDGENENSLIQHELEIIGDILNSKTKYRKIIQAGIAQWVKDFQEGRIKIDTVDDLKKLIEVDMYLQKQEIYLRR